MSGKTVFIRARAEADIDAALAFYVAEAPEQAPELLDALQATLQKLRSAPALGSPRWGVDLDIPGLRHLRTPRFPHLVFYLETEKEVDVIRVLDERRDLPGALEEE